MFSEQLIRFIVGLFELGIGLVLVFVFVIGIGLLFGGLTLMGSLVILGVVWFAGSALSKKR